MLRGRIVSNSTASTCGKLEASSRRANGCCAAIAASPIHRKPASKTPSWSAGTWWDAGSYTGENRWSRFAAEEAGELGLNIGDTITVNVLGRNVTATHRQPARGRMGILSINFVMVFSPSTFAGAPHAPGSLTLSDPRSRRRRRRSVTAKSCKTQSPTPIPDRHQRARQGCIDLVNGIGRASSQRPSAPQRCRGAGRFRAGAVRRALAAGNRARASMTRWC